MSPNIPASDHTTEDLYTSENISSRSKIEMEFVTELTFTKANCLKEMPTSSESSKLLQQKSLGYRKIHSFSKRHKSCSNLLRDVKELQENARRLSLKKHDREVQQLHDTLDMLGRVSSYIKTKVITNLSVARSLARPSFLPPDATPAPPLCLLTTSDSHLEAEEEAELGRTLPIIEYKQAPLCSRGQEKTKLSLPPCSYKLERDLCNSFPCVVPREYTSIGFQLKPDNSGVHRDHRIRKGNSEQDNTIWSSPQCEKWSRWNSLRRPIRSHANDKISLREASLNCAIDQSRRKHETLRVNEWETMYGEKIPITLIKKLQGLRRRDCTGGGRRASSIVQSMTERPFRY